MNEASHTISKVGSLREFADWTKRVVHNAAAADEAPKQWCDGPAALPGVGGSRASAEAMVKMLSPGNLAVLDAIRRLKPGSVRELAALTGRKEASLSRTLKRFVELDIVAFEDGPHRKRVPAVIARRVHLDIDLTGCGSAVVVEGKH